MTNKTIEAIAKSMLEDFKGRDIKKCDYGFNGNVLNLVELLELALREQAAQATLPSYEDFRHAYFSVDQGVDEGWSYDVDMHIADLYRWLAKNMKGTNDK